MLPLRKYLECDVCGQDSRHCGHGVETKPKVNKRSIKKQKRWYKRLYEPKCYKVGYGSKRDAHTSASMRINDPDSTITALAAYKCPDCGKWHLTRNPQKKQKMIYV